MISPLASVFLNQISWVFLFDGMGPLGQWVTALVATIALLFTTYFNWRNLKKKKRMVYSIDSQHHLFSANSETQALLSDKFQVNYKNESGVYQPILEPYLLMIKFKNACKNTIIKEDFARPILLQLPHSAKILEKPIINSPHGVGFAKELNDSLTLNGNTLQISVSTIHPRKFFKLTVITNGNPHGFELDPYCWSHKGSRLEEINLNEQSNIWYFMLIALCMVCILGASMITVFYYLEIKQFILVVFVAMAIGIVYFSDKISKENNHG